MAASTNPHTRNYKALSQSIAGGATVNTKVTVAECDTIRVMWIILDAAAVGDLTDTEVRGYDLEQVVCNPAMTPVTAMAKTLTGARLEKTEVHDVRGLDAVQIRMKNGAVGAKICELHVFRDRNS